MNTRVGISNRHVHLTREDVNILFGNNYELTKRNDLDQPGCLLYTSISYIKIIIMVL